MANDQKRPTEREEAIALANRVLERVNADPDDDLAVLARQCLRRRLADMVKAAAPTLRDLLIEQNKVESRIYRALKREYPIGSYVYWKHGLHEQRGRVLQHSADWCGSGGRLLAENTRTGNRKWLDASAVHHGATGEFL